MVASTCRGAVMAASEPLTTHDLSTSRRSSSSSCLACSESNTSIHGAVVIKPSSESYPGPPFASMRSTDDDAAIVSVSPFQAASLRFVAELPSSLVAVWFPSRISPEVTFVRDDAITARSSSFWHPMSVFPRSVSVRFVEFLCAPLILSGHPLLPVRVDTFVDDDGSVMTGGCFPRFFPL